jgi:hypothetical protein
MNTMNILADAAATSGLGEFTPYASLGIVGVLVFVLVWGMRTAFPRLMDKHELQITRLLDDHKNEQSAIRQWHEREVASTRQHSDGERVLFREALKEVNATVQTAIRGQHQ